MELDLECLNVKLISALEICLRSTGTWEGRKLSRFQGQ